MERKESALQPADKGGMKSTTDTGLPGASRSPGLAGSRLVVSELSVAYGDQLVLDRLTLCVESGRTLVVLGESGCGKTTLLRALAGAIAIQSGAIEWDEVDLTHVSAQQRGVIYLDQEPLLFEHLTVAENLGFALELRQVPRAEKEQAVQQMLVALELQAHGGKREWELSGGQRQRVAFGRALLARPRLLLLDEPFCSLDGKTRGQMQQLFARLSREHLLTSIFVTHDVKEAVVIGDSFARMQTGTLYSYPSRDAFLRDPATGIPAEIEFWRDRAQEAQGQG
ncbi:MAG: ABC transporter ATP-binding protein [Planctomycetota bacterium]